MADRARVRPSAPVPAALLLAALLLAGCQPPPSPDDATVAGLRAGVVATIAAMEVPAERRPSERALADNVGLLAIQSPAERQAAIRDGGVGAASVVGPARDMLFRFARERPGMSAPEMLVWLAAHPEGLSRDQLLVLDALTSQLEREAKLKER